MNNLVTFLFCFIICFFSFGQSSGFSFDEFLNKFDLKPLPIIVDEITLINLETKNQLNYKDVKKFIIDEDKIPYIEVNDTISNKFYSFGKLKVDDGIGIIFSHVTNQSKSIYIGIFNVKNELIWFSSIGFIGNNGFDEKFATIILPNLMFLKVRDIYLANDLSVDVFEANGDFLFSNFLCNDYADCINYVAQLKNTPVSFNLNLKFDKSFLLNLKALIPLQFCSPARNCQVLSSIDNEKKKKNTSHFVGSKILKNNNLIVFFFNVFEFENYYNVMEIGYQIFNEEGKLIKMDNFCEYAENKEKKIILNKIGEIKDLDNKIQIFSYESGFTNLIEFEK